MTGKDELLFALSDIDGKYVRCVASMLRGKPVPTWRSVMKKSVKFAVAAVAAVLVIGVLTVAMLLQSGPESVPPTPGAASKTQEPLRICVDLGSNMDEWQGVSEQEKSLKSLVADLDFYSKYYHIPASEEIKLEIIPSSEEKPSERSAALQRVRTEIMTGGGPDVFVCRTEGSYEDQFDLSESRLFPYVDKAIQEDCFLPLDDYLESLEMTNWNDLSPEIMAGGKNGRGEQVLIPMRYSIPSVVFRQADVPPQEASGLSWDDIQNGDDPFLSEQLRWGWGIDFVGDAGRKDRHQNNIPYLAPVADFSSGALSVSEEELTQLIWKNLQSVQALMQKDPVAENEAVLPDNFWLNGCPLSSTTFPSQVDMTILPMPNRGGGATAVVYSYCAINRNAQKAEEAISFLDFLMSESSQKVVWGAPGTFCTGAGMPVNQKALTREHTGFTEASLAEWKKAVKQVNFVHLPSPLDLELNDMVEEIQFAVIEGSGVERNIGYTTDYYLDEFYTGSITEEELSAIVHEHYEEMKRLLGES